MSLAAKTYLGRKVTDYLYQQTQVGEAEKRAVLRTSRKQPEVGISWCVSCGE